jgi:hypothetical protein
MVVAASIVWAPNASAAPTALLWGPRFGHSTVVYHQAAGQGAEIVSSSGAFRFDVQTDGNLDTYARQQTTWYAYWSSRTNGRGAYFYLQSDGNLVEKASDNATIVWKSGKAPGTAYNYELLIQNDGNLVEYYSTGDPRVSTGQHVAWATNRLVTRRVCNGGTVGASQTTDASALTLSSNDTLTIKNSNFLGLAVTTWRQEGGSAVDRNSYVIGPYSSHTFPGYYDGYNGPVLMDLRISTPSSSVLATWSITGTCFYNP